jgi:hypothetical protein
MTALDVYSDLKVPFEVATWARGHRFNVVAVDIARSIKTLKAIAETRERLETQEEEIEAELRNHIALARKKMETGNGI